MKPNHTVLGGSNAPADGLTFRGSSQANDQTALYESPSLAQSDGAAALPHLPRLFRTGTENLTQTLLQNTPDQTRQPGFGLPGNNDHRVPVGQLLCRHNSGNPQRCQENRLYPPAFGHEALTQTRIDQTHGLPLGPETPAASLAQRRKTKCVNCRADKGRRLCIGYPKCELCVSELTDGVDLSHVLDEICLSRWPYWYWICKETGKYHFEHPDTSFTARKLDFQHEINYETFSDSRISESMKNIVLEFSFIDRTASTPNVVILYPQEQTEMCRSGKDWTNGKFRAPAINLAQLDTFVRDGVWGKTLCELPAECQLSPCEQNLWSKVLLLVGYVSLSHNLATVSMQAVGYMPHEMQRRVAAEVVFTIGWRLGMLWYEVSTACQPLISKKEPESRPKVIFYAIELLYRLMQSMQQCDWAIPTQSLLYSLKALQDDLSAGVKRIRSALLGFECVASGASESSRRFQQIPDVLKFARESKGHSFPRKCHLTAYPHRENPGLTPMSWDSSFTRRLVDILSLQSEDDGEDVDSQGPETFVDSDNGLCTAEDLLPTGVNFIMTAAGMRPRVRRLGGATMPNDDGRSLVPARAQTASDNLNQDMTTLKANDGTARITPVPSLTHECSPVPVPSPVTPRTADYSG